MRNRKKFAIVLLALLTACSGRNRSPLPQESTTLTFLSRDWSQADEIQRAETTTEEGQRAGFSVKYIPLPEPTLDQFELTRELLEKHGPVPDLLTVDVIWPGSLAPYLIDLRPSFPQELAALSPELVANYTVNGRVVAIPAATLMGVLEYRRDLLTKYGYDHPPRTWNELEQMSDRVQNGEREHGHKDFWGYVWQGAAAEGLVCNGLEWQVAEGGGQIVEKDGAITVNNRATMRAWQRGKRWIGWISPPSVTAYREIDALNAFDSGNALFRRTWAGAVPEQKWSWQAIGNRWRRPIPARDIGYTSLPSGAVAQVGTLGGVGIGVSSNSIHQKEAIEFIRLLFNMERRLNQDALKQDTLEGPELRDLPDRFEEYNSDAKTSRSLAVSRPSVVIGDKYKQVSSAYTVAIHSFLTGKDDAATALADLEKQLTAIVGSPTNTPASRPLDARPTKR